MKGLPSWDEFMIPMLQVLSDGSTRSFRELRRDVADVSVLTPEQRAETLPSGQLKSENRIGWAASYLTRVGALTRPQRGLYTITEMGRGLLAKHPLGITELELRSFAKPGDEWWMTKAPGGDGDKRIETPTAAEQLDPTEQVEQGVARIHADVAADLLTRLHGQEPEFFERAVVDLLLAMGYGGAHGSGAPTRLARDGGIDGIIDQDALGVNKLYVQAKRYALDTAVGAPEVQAFVGAISGKADGGIFITTGRFTSDAKRYSATAHARVILIDGQRLAELMIRHEVGVQVKQTHRIVEVDEDFFS
ncbi:MAG: restriction endonuclease [Demequinaceae bacterium]|nr:restriction endonuclease [Demequinaceae bacterium]